MSEINSLRNSTKMTLYDIAKHANALAIGLQNAAPPQEGGPSKSILYLSEVAIILQEQIKLLDASQE